jgi:hypothetical protein
MKSLLAILAIAMGVAAIVLGGIDDAPGPQLLGVLLVVGVGSAWLFRRRAQATPRGRRAAGLVTTPSDSPRTPPVEAPALTSLSEDSKIDLQQSAAVRAATLARSCR